MTHEFGRTGQLFRLALRRDRWVMPWWVFALGAITAVYYQQFEKLYPTEAERQTLVIATKANPAWVALSGPLLSNSVGALALWKSSITVVVLALAVPLSGTAARTRSSGDASCWSQPRSGVLRTRPLRF